MEEIVICEWFLGSILVRYLMYVNSLP